MTCIVDLRQFQIYSHSYFNFCKLDIHNQIILLSGTVGNFINKLPLFVVVPYFPFNLLALKRATNCLRTNLRLASRPNHWSSINNCPIDVCRKLQMLFCFRGCQRGYTVTKPELILGHIPLRKKKIIKFKNNHLGVCTLPMYQYIVFYCILIAPSPKFILDSSECNFICLSAEHISYLVSNQDNR